MLQQAVESLTLLKEETDVSKRFKEKAESILTLLGSTSELAIEKALLELFILSLISLSLSHL